MSSTDAASVPEIDPPDAALDGALDEMLDLLASHEPILVVSHEEPDGDAIGSTLATGLWLASLGRSVDLYNRDGVPDQFDFLPGADRVLQSVPRDCDYAVTIALDFGAPDRVGEGFPERGWGDSIVVVDHHETWDPDFADVYVRDPTAAATAEILYRAIRRSGAELDADIAQSLYSAIMTDTGSFQYSNTSRTTFRVAGELLAAGVDPWEMTCHLYESEPRRRVELLGDVLQTLEVSSDGRLAFLQIDDALVEPDESIAELTDGFINYARSIRGVEVATQLREMGRDDQWKVTFRSRGTVDVSQLASAFGGGGHHNAAGCTMEGPPASIRRRLTERLREILDDA
jgi:phosphoesterase RecJ-like protein